MRLSHEQREKRPEEKTLPGGAFLLGLLLVLMVGSGCGEDISSTVDDGAESETRTKARELNSVCGADKYGPVQGVDVSEHQGTFDWKRYKNQGLRFGFARISDGLNHVDHTFDRNWRAMKNHGIARGAYQYFRPSQNAAEQARMMVRKVGGKLGKNDLPCVIDVEDTGGLSPSALRQKVRTWLKIVRDGTGKKPIIYTSPYFWEDHVKDSSLGSYPLWVAHYGASCPSLPSGWNTWSFWQYCNGDKQYCKNGEGFDRNVFNTKLPFGLGKLTGSSAPRYDAALNVSLAPGAKNRLRDGRSRHVKDVFEKRHLVGVIALKNRSNRPLKKVRVGYHFDRHRLRPVSYRIQARRKGQKHWRTVKWLQKPKYNPRQRHIRNYGSFFLGGLRVGEKRRVVIRFEARQYSLPMKRHVELRGWLKSVKKIYRGAHGGVKHFGEKPAVNKFARHKIHRARAHVDVIDRDTWTFDGHAKQDQEGWRACQNSDTLGLFIERRGKYRSQLVVNGAGPRPCAKSPKWTRVDARRFDQMVIRLKSDRGPHRVAVMWKPSRKQGWHNARRVVVDAIGDGQFETLVIPIGENPRWRGIVRRLRITPDTNAPTAECKTRYDIDRVYFQSSKTQATSSPVVDFASHPPATLL